MEYTIPCAVVARFANVLKIKPPEATEWSDTIRIENGFAIASNRRILAVENIGGSQGIIHLIADPVLVAQCANEATFDSMLHITAEPALKHAVCVTTMGYKHPRNCVLWSNSENYLDGWRGVLPIEQPKKPNGGMFWHGEMIADLARSSPSGRVIFAEIIDVTKPTVIRDTIDPDWFGVFLPDQAQKYDAARLPEWVR